MISIRLALARDNAFIHLLHDRHFAELTTCEYLKWIGQRNRRVYTIEYFGEPAGFVFIALERDAVRLCRIAIVDHYQRQRVASDAVRLILGKHGKRLIRSAFADDPDSVAQDFLRSLGMRAKAIAGEPKNRYWVYEGQNTQRVKR